VVGSALVNCLAGNLDANGAAEPGLVGAVLGMVSELAGGVAPGRLREDAR